MVVTDIIVYHFDVHCQGIFSRCFEITLITTFVFDLVMNGLDVFSKAISVPTFEGTARTCEILCLVVHNSLMSQQVAFTWWGITAVVTWKLSKSLWWTHLFTVQFRIHFQKRIKCILLLLVCVCLGHHFAEKPIQSHKITQRRGNGSATDSQWE